MRRVKYYRGLQLSEISYYPVIIIHHYIYERLNIICCIYAGPLLLCVRHQGHHRQLYHPTVISFCRLSGNPVIDSLPVISSNPIQPWTLDNRVWPIFALERSPSHPLFGRVTLPPWPPDQRERPPAFGGVVRDIQWHLYYWPNSRTYIWNVPFEILPV